MDRLQKLLAGPRPILLDGSMGTMLMSLGLTDGAPPEEWNETHPEKVRQVHRGYIEAGSRVILTNSFGGSSYRLQLHDLDDCVFELNRAAATIARAEADMASRPVVVAGSLGPTGELLEPMGSMNYEGAREAFAEQARGLAAGGVDLFWVETMSDLREVTAAIEGVRAVTDLPIAATMSFDTHGRTMMGVRPQEAVAALKPYDLVAIGANCGNGLKDINFIITQMRLADTEVPIIAKANAGIPVWVGAQLVYDGTPEVMAGYSQQVRDLGVQFIGACCGSTPTHVEAMAEALQRPSATPASLPPAHQVTMANQRAKRGRRRRTRRRPKK